MEVPNFSPELYKLYNNQDASLEQIRREDEKSADFAMSLIKRKATVGQMAFTEYGETDIYIKPLQLNREPEQTFGFCSEYQLFKAGVEEPTLRYTWDYGPRGRED